MTTQYNDLIICVQYVVSNATSVKDITKLIEILSTSNDQIDNLFMLKLILHCLPNFLLCSHDIVDLVESAIGLQKVEQEYFDLAMLFDDDVPVIVRELMFLDNSKKEIMVKKLTDSIDSTATNYICVFGDNCNNDAIFDTFMKSLILKLQADFASFEITNGLVSVLKSNNKLADFINNFYSPVEILGCSSLLDFEFFLPVEDRVGMIMSKYKNSRDPVIISDVLLPLFSRDLNYWTAFNSWLLKFGEKSVKELDDKKIIQNFQFLNDLLRNDNLLKQIDTMDIKYSFISIMISIIYFSPKAILQVFISAKEILLIISESIGLNSDNAINFRDFQSYFELASSNITSYQSVNILTGLITAAELLYCNGLSIVDIINLKYSPRGSQILELNKFLDSELQSNLKNGKQIKLFLTSLFTIFEKESNIFNQISKNDLFVTILEKLLSLKKIQLIKNIQEFNTLSDEEYNSIILDSCWKFYLRASNCDQNIGYLKDCKDCLELVSLKDETYRKIEKLLLINDKILNWKFYLQNGTPFKPKDLLDIDDPWVIINKILELNEKSYLQLKELYELLVILLDVLQCKEASLSFNDKHNLLAYKLKLKGLEFSTLTDYSFSYESAMDLLSVAVSERYNIDGVYELMSDNWFLFFQLSKIEYELLVLDYNDLKFIENKLNLLSKLMLVAPTQFNSNILDQWQMLNSQKDHMLESEDLSGSNSNISSADKKSSLGDVQDRLHRSIKSSAEGLVNVDSSEIGKNIVGWIIGAN